MKTIKNQFLAFVTVISFLTLNSCQKEDKFELGDIQTGFELDMIYKATSDGFLTVQFTSNAFGGDPVNIFSDNNENPTTLIGKIGTSSTATLPIKKNNYWKVVKGIHGSVVLGFTPILNNK